MKPVSAEQIDAVLPQTQCGLCGYNGCMPYANALAAKTAAINLCPPGGIDGLIAIAELVNEDPSPFFAEMESKTKPAMRAVIREEECIGCTKCIKVCPVDAILGSAKQMHSVITDECTGCDLCIAPCPVDCIDMVPAQSTTEDKKNHYRKRYQNRLRRLEQDQIEIPVVQQTNPDKKSYIEQAILRAKEKKFSRS